MMKFLFFVIVFILGVAASADEKNHNGPQHQALCNLMKAAVGKWGEVEKRVPTDPLRKALRTTLFGYGTVETLETLKSSLPKDYEGVEEIPESRGLWCGEPRGEEWDHGNVHQNLWSGHSAPHDMMCLCTVGDKGFPLNETSSPNEKLCGKDKDALGASDKQGWTGSESASGSKHVTATWENITVPCLNGEAGGDLKQALNEFLGKLENTTVKGYTNRRQLGAGTPDVIGACDGSTKRGVCVEYYLSMTPKPWWDDLQKAIPEDEKLQKRREEEKRKQQEEAAKKEAQKTETLKSGHPTTNQTEQNNHHSNLTDKLRRYNLTSGTLITPPCIWPLGAVFLI
ncbi:Variant surface glycoprotein [Trypanosoma congolense IL3000]|uniref:Variant surface glycoprotein n=1 Tax=Trypanosoma congolense (strain IL3000) TaxID=1068625 RepID=F9WAL5_TRYCI|nr:Variant surface glycoprotein [Trypanosoma congolense IL3000]